MVEVQVLRSGLVTYKDVLGASTMAKTGAFEETAMNLSALFGMLLVATGYISRKKQLTIKN